MYTKLCIKLNSESGMALLVAMFVTFLSSIMLTFYMGSVIQESKHSVWQKERAQSLFLAEAGVQKGLYYLNNLKNLDNPWAPYIDPADKVLLVSEDQVPEYTGTDVDDPNDQFAESYTISLHNRFVDADGSIVTLPPRFFLIKSEGLIKRTIPISRRVSAIVSIIPGVPAPGALNIFDVADGDDELLQFQSSQWVVSGVDMDGLQPAVPGITVSNRGDDIVGQLDLPGLPTRIDQVEGADEFGDVVNGPGAIRPYDGGENPTSIMDMLYDHFMSLLWPEDDVSGLALLKTEHLGSPTDPQILYANLNEGNLIVPGSRAGYGVIILEGEGVFELKGGSEWYGLVLCYGGAKVAMRGGGVSASHIYGCVMIDTGTVTMNGTADIRYSSLAMSMIENGLLRFQVFAWCGGWGKPLGRFGGDSEV
ncbi:hypothetical protein ACFL6S_12520 [Candidatus Poribacteria bacterium]